LNPDWNWKGLSVTTRAIYVLTAATTAASLGIFSLPALAEDGGFYVGANVGKVLSTYRRADIDGGLTDQLNQLSGTGQGGGSVSSSSIGKSHAMWSVDVGYMLTPNVGIEASYIDLGRIKYAGAGSAPLPGGAAGTTPMSFSLDTRSHGPALAAIGVLPMTNSWELDARVGAVEAKNISSSTITLQDEGSGSSTASKTTTSLLLGVGTGFIVSTHWTVRLDYMRVAKLDDPALEKHFNVDILTVGADFMF
jgi:opacity protein-like surface antigen